MGSDVSDLAGKTFQEQEMLLSSNFTAVGHHPNVLPSSLTDSKVRSNINDIQPYMYLHLSVFKCNQVSIIYLLRKR